MLVSAKLVDCWDESYSRYENNVLEPYEELVKFLARFVFDRDPGTGAISLKGRFADKIPPNLQFIDIGCGVGAQSEHLAKLGFEVQAFDVSDVAIGRAIERCAKAGLQSNTSFSAINPTEFEIMEPFDIAIACASLDSMPFDSAVDWIRKASLKIQDNGLLFATLIGPSAKDSEAKEEVITNELHEKGTIQSYFNEAKILSLFESGGFSIERMDLIETTRILPEDKELRSSKRYSIVASH